MAEAKGDLAAALHPAIKKALDPLLARKQEIQIEQAELALKKADLEQQLVGLRDGLMWDKKPVEALTDTRRAIDDTDLQITELVGAGRGVQRLIAGRKNLIKYVSDIGECVLKCQGLRDQIEKNKNLAHLTDDRFAITKIQDHIDKMDQRMDSLLDMMVSYKMSTTKMKSAMREFRESVSAAYCDLLPDMVTSQPPKASGGESAALRASV